MLLGSGLLCLSAGLCLSRRLLGPGSHASELLLGAFVCAVSLVTLGVLACGLVIRDMSLPVVAAVVCLPAAAMIVAWRGGALEAVRHLREGLGAVLGEFDAWAWCLAALFLLAAALVLVKIALLPPLVWDVWTYHLPPAVEWFQRGYIPTHIDTPVARVDSMTHGMPLLIYWCFVFLGNDAWVELPQFLWGLVLLPLAFAALRRAGLDRAWAFKFAVATWFVPACLLFSRTCQDHLGLTVSFVAGAYFLEAAARRRRLGELLLSATAFGLCLGYKNTGPLFVVTALAVTAVGAGRWVWSEARARPGRAVSTALACGLLVMALGGYWYAKNLWAFGNVRGSGEMARVVVLSGPGMLHRTWNTLSANLSAMPIRVLDYEGFYTPDLTDMSGYGPQFLAFGLFGLAVFLLRAPRRMLRDLRDGQGEHLAWSALLLMAAYFGVYFSQCNYRHLLFFCLAFVLYGAMALHRRGVLAGARRTVSVLLILCAAWSLTVTIQESLSRPWQMRQYMTGPARYRTPGTMSRYAGSSRDYDFIVNHAAVTDGVAYTGFRDKWIYVYYDRAWRRVARHVPSGMLTAPGGDFSVSLVGGGLKDFMRREGLTLLDLVGRSNYEELVLDDPEFYRLRDGLYCFLDRGGP